MAALVTGVTGFIGYFVTKSLLATGLNIYGVDNLNDYYDVRLKYGRLEELKKYSQFTFGRLDLFFNRPGMLSLFQQQQYQYVIHLAAQAGVRYSLENAFAFADSHLYGCLTPLEGWHRWG